MIEFPYREEESRFFGKVWRPVVEVHLIDQQGSDKVNIETFK